jgi:hypothetical protein
LIGLLGWGYFAGLISFLLDRLPGPRRWLAVLLAPALVHVLLLATWWGALRRLPRVPIPALVAAAVALAVALGLAVFVRRTRRAVGLDVMGPRMAAASLFFVLLAWRGTDTAPLLVYGAAFAPPYLLATRWGTGSA